MSERLAATLEGPDGAPVLALGTSIGTHQGLFGSQFYVNELNTQQTANTLAMLDYDMIASTNWLPFVYTDCDRSVAGNTCAPPSSRSRGRSWSNRTRGRSS